jgi:hypothetical protein
VQIRAVTCQRLTLAQQRKRLAPEPHDVLLIARGDWIFALLGLPRSWQDVRERLDARESTREPLSEQPKPRSSEGDQRNLGRRYTRLNPGEVLDISRSIDFLADLTSRGLPGSTSRTIGIERATPSAKQSGCRFGVSRRPR